MDQSLPLLYASFLWEAVTSTAISEASKSRFGSGHPAAVTSQCSRVGHYFDVWVEKACETLCDFGMSQVAEEMQEPGMAQRHHRDSSSLSPWARSTRRSRGPVWPRETFKDASPSTCCGLRGDPETAKV